MYSVKLEIIVLMSLFLDFQYSQYSFSPSKGGIQLPSNSSLYGHSPIPGTVYYSHFICPDTASSIDNCSPQNGGDHCYSGELDFVVQCTIRMSIIHAYILTLLPWRCCLKIVCVRLTCLCAVSIYLI